MSDLLFSLEAVIPLFAAVFLGYFLRVKNMIGDQFINGANRLTFKVVLPLLIFYNIISNDFTGAVNMKLIGFAIGGVLAAFLLALVLVPLLIKDNTQRGVVIQCIFRSNFLLFGLPLVKNLFGEDGTLAVSMLIAIIVPIFNALAVVALSIFSKKNQTGKKQNWKAILLDIIKNPLIIASVCGFLVGLLPFSLPNFLLKSIKDISAMATPLALLALGGTFRFESARTNLKAILIAVSGRVLIVPGIMLTAAVLCGFRGAELGALTALFASPVAVSSYVMAVNAEGDGQLAAHLVVFTTVASALTIFGFVYFMKALNLF
ncbi:MAG: AEC family transporter [Eubacteriales bacterium]|nr:AEC family transporter [Eubacteriales bacterium]